MTDTNWSVPEREVLATVRDVLAGDGRGVLATVVRVEGSAYRRPGAKMVVTGDGDVGHVTAGCLEDEVDRLADEVLAAGEPRVERYDLRPETDDDVWGLGVGCNGLIDVLLEPVDESCRPVVDAVEAGADVGVVTVIEGDGETPVGARAHYDPVTGEFSLGDAFPASLAARVRDATADLVARGRSDAVDVGDLTLFVDGVVAPDDLVVVGAGNDVGPVVELGARAGFRVTVVGFRGAKATPDRFPAAAEVRSTSPADLREAVDLDADTYVVVATHNFVDDRIAVGELLDSPVPYVGLMGPRERFERMLDDLSVEDADLDRLYTPVGLDLGGGSPQEIAFSIVGEVLAVSNGREPRHLREREGPIHDRVEVTPDQSSGS